MVDSCKCYMSAIVITCFSYNFFGDIFIGKFRIQIYDFFVIVKRKELTFVKVRKIFKKDFVIKKNTLPLSVHFERLCHCGLNPQSQED